MSRKLVIGLLVMLAMVVTSFTYAYWATLDYSVSELSNTVEIGEGYTATASVSVTADAAGVTLVPNNLEGSSVSASPVDYVIFTFAVSLADNRAGLQTGTLGASVSNILIAAAATNNTLVVTAVQIGGTATGETLNGDGSTTITEGTPLTVYVKVTLTEPSTEAIYLEIFGQDITFDVDFVVTPA